jgi:hypothetical protein
MKSKQMKSKSKQPKTWSVGKTFKCNNIDAVEEQIKCMFCLYFEPW